MAPQAKPTCWPTVVASGLAEATFFACGNAPRFGERDLAPAILTGRRGTVVASHGGWPTVLMAAVMGIEDVGEDPTKRRSNMNPRILQQKTLSRGVAPWGHLKAPGSLPDPQGTPVAPPN
jgi:hypothetical protein